jgi:hypothetical protein
MSKITIDWEFWKYAWGSYLGKKPGQYPRQSDEVQLLPFSKESEAVLDVMQPDYWMQCWELWNAPLALPGSYFHALPVKGDARHIFPDWNAFFRAGSPWTHATGVYPRHLSLLIFQWSWILDDYKAYDQAQIQKNSANVIACEAAYKEKRRQMGEDLRNSSGTNPYILSAIYKAGTGTGINIPVQGPLGAAMVDSWLKNGLKPPAEREWKFDL